MIEEAKKSYPHLEFATVDALKISYECEWDIIFSNAVFHWINDHNLLLQKIFRALKPNGKLICEFGAYGNISVIENGFNHAIQKMGMTYTSKFNFPMVSDFESLLTSMGVEFVGRNANKRVSNSIFSVFLFLFLFFPHK